MADSMTNKTWLEIGALSVGGGISAAVAVSIICPLTPAMFIGTVMFVGGYSIIGPWSVM